MPRYAYVLAVLLSVIMMSVTVPVLSEESDAVSEYTADIVLDVDEYAEIDLQDHLGGNSYRYCTFDKYSGNDSLPLGLSRDGSVLKGTPTRIGEYSMGFNFRDSTIGLTYDAHLNIVIRVEAVPEEFTVTYDAGIGNVKGSKTWKETITEGTYASLPDATYSNGAYTFMGWARSSTSTDTLDSLKVTSDVTLYAVWERNTVRMSDSSATITRDQTSSLTVFTDPSDAKLSIVDLGGLSEQNVRISGHTLRLDMTSVDPGTYFVTLEANKTGYLAGRSTVTVSVPICIVKPIEYILNEGDVFSYTPVTNPTNASISMVGVLLNGAPIHDSGLELKGRTITGTLSQTGTYEITYRASLEGYVDVTNSVIVYVNNADDNPVTGDVSLESITASSRGNEPRVFDFIAIGSENVTNFVWSVEGEVFASSSPTALYEFPSSGVYTVTCTAYGGSGDSVSLEITVVCTDNRHRDAAWSDVEYSYILQGQADVTVPNGSFLSSRVEEIGGSRFTIVSGTPSSSDIGKQFTVTVGDESWNVTVYQKETEPPKASFSLSVTDDGYSVKAEFTGSNASFHRFDFNNDGEYENGDTFTYSKPGRYVVSCIAVNNISETVSSMHIDIDYAPSESTDLSGLTDFVMGVGERLYIEISLVDGDELQVSGSASVFTVVDGNVLRISPTETGVYDLTVTALHLDGTSDSVTVEVKVTGPYPPVKDDEEQDYILVIVLFVISISIVCIVVIFDMHSGKVSAWLSSRSRKKGMNTTTNNRNRKQNSNNRGGWR